MARPTPYRTTRGLHAALTAVAASVALTVLIGGVPWALVRFVGWPLPDRFPAWPEVVVVLTMPLSTGLLLDLLAIACWVAWAAFVVDVARCALAAAHDTAWPHPRRCRNPVRGLAAILVAAVLVPVLTGRAAPTDAAGPVATTGALYRTVAATQPDAGKGPVRETVVVRDLDPRTGVHDSLWRIAARELGDGTRWPEIFAANHGKPQPDGGIFDRPSLIFPGEELRLPTPHAAVPDPGMHRTDPTPTPSAATPTMPVPSIPKSSPPSATRVPAPSATPAPPTAPATPSRGAPPATAPSLTAVPAPTGPAPGSPDRPAIAIGPDVFVGAGLAAAVSAALLLARRRHRRRYLPGSGHRDDLAVAPAVYALRLAHLRADHPDSDDPDTDDTDAGKGGNWGHPARQLAGENEADNVVVAVAKADDGIPHPSGRERSATPDRGPSRAGAGGMVVGVRDGVPAALDLATAHGLGLVGAGAPAAARALLLHALTASPPSGQVVVPAADLAALLGQPPHPEPLPAGLRVPNTLGAALDLLEATTVAHATPRPGPNLAGVPGAPLALLATVPASSADRARLQAVLDNGSSYGITGLLLGQWRAGATVHVRADGQVSATDPGPGEVLRGTRMFHLGATDTADLLALLGQAHPQAPDPPAPAHPVPDAAGGPARARAAVSPQDLEVSSGVDDGPSPPPTAWHHPTGLPLAAEPSRRSADAGLPGPALWVEVFGPPRISWRPAREADPRPPRSTTDEDPDGESGQDPTEPGEPDPDPTRDWVDVTGMFQPRTRELLVFLAVHPDGATREALTAALWPDLPPERLSNAVNTALSRLRRAVRAATADTVTDLVLLGDGRYQLDPGLVDTDYRAFAAAQAARRAAATDTDRHTAHHAIIDSYRGPLAEGMSTEWIETARESIRRDVLDAVAATARALVATDPQQTLDLLEIARAFDPHNELLYRDIMRLQARLGLLDAIPRTLTLLTTRLAELGEQPSPHTVDLAGRLCAGEPPAADGSSGRRAS